MHVKSLNKGFLALNAMLALTLSVLVLHRLPGPPATAVPEGPAKETPTLDRPIPRPYAGLASASDWRQWIDTLREAGVPTRVLARLVREGFDDAWLKRQAEGQAAYMRGDIDPAGLAALSIKHDLEQEKAIHAALGEEDFRKWDLQNVLQSVNLRDVQLTEAETNALYTVEKNLRQRLNELQLAKLNGEIDQAGLDDQQAKAQADHDQQLKALLGDQRYATMQDTDEDAGDLQRGLSEVTLPADVSFESLLAMQNQWNERRGEMNGQIQEAKSQISNYEQELKRLDDEQAREFQRVLGTNGFDSLQKGQDTRFAEMKRYADTWELDDASIDYVYQNIKFYEKSVEDYQQQARLLEAQGQDVDWDAMNKNLQHFSEQTGQALRNYLGDDRFNKIKSNQIFQFVPAK